MTKNRFFTTSNIAKIAILSSISYVLMLFELTIPFLPSFYKLDFSEVSVLIGGFTMGPLAAIIIEAIKILFKAISSTQTAYVGELANFLIGISFVVPASIIYKNNKTKKYAIIGLLVGSISMTVVGVLLNYFVLLPAYSYFYNVDMSVLINMGTILIPIIKDSLTFVIFATTPFNIIKAICVSLVTLILYKHISVILKR